MATTSILIDDLTSGTITEVDGSYVWSGDGIFDKLISAVNGNIRAQFDNGRITDDKYADVYLGSMQTVIAESMRFLLQQKQAEAQVDLLQSQEAKAVQDEAYVAAQEIALRAKIEDEHGKIIDNTNSSYTVSNSDYNIHTHTINRSEQQVKSEEQSVARSKKEVEILGVDKVTREAQLEIEYGKQVKPIVHYTSDSGLELEYDLRNGVTLTDTELLTLRYSIADTTNVSITGAMDVNNASGTIPPSKFHAEMIKARTEANIAINTTKGYLGDVFFKQAKVLQELTFSLANAGVISKDNVDASGGIYEELATSIEKSLNGMSTIFGKDLTQDTVEPFINIDNSYVYTEVVDVPGTYTRTGVADYLTPTISI